MLAIIGFVVVLLIAIGLLLAGGVLVIFTGIGGSPKKSEIAIGLMYIALSGVLAAYAVANSPFTITVKP